MRLSELAAETGVGIPTLKFYMREGLVPPGERVNATTSRYAVAHVERVRLVRALVDGLGLSLAQVRTVVSALDRPPASRHELLGAAQAALPSPYTNHAVTEEVRDLVARRGWSVHPGATALRSLSGAIEAARAAGVELAPATLDAYAAGVETIAAADVAAAWAAATPEKAVAVVALGTALVDPVLAAMRRLADEAMSAQT